MTDMFPGANDMSIEHFLNEDWEAWALERAHRIMVQEGANLVNAAQWLDKKQTIKTSQQLRDAIQQSLIEALALQSTSRSPAMAEH
ncbi:hypothetical protein ACQZ61_13115 [Agrobacterium vitis]|uniref:hypothetical protein n=1 Tax=Agrobacterium vitis TaxID=373 RepID=UPI0015DC7D95|nr:hypothetical protein [Agrobacterium vitis]BCH54388.1 hypothetical protein RvVAR031_19980 [Agrobacterium vitis]